MGKLGLLVSLMICCFLVRTEGYRILGIFPFCSKSHQMMFDALSKGLARRGHQLEIVTCFPPKKPIANFTVLMNVENSQTPLVNSWTVDLALNVGSDTLKAIIEVYGNDLCHLMGREEMQRIIKNPPKDPPYDLIIVEAFGANCFIGLGALFNVPVIFASTTIEMPWINRAIGNPSNLAYFPSFFADFRHPLTFWERVKNVVHDAIIMYRYNAMAGDVQTQLMRKYLHPDIPHIRELEKKVTLALINSFYTLSGVRGTTTGLIEVGGLHVEDNDTELSKDLKKWLDESKHGVVYFTLGSMVNIETMPDDVIKGLYNSFEKIAPIKVLMKIANKDKLLPGQPKNLITSSWIPQVQVLAHKNTKLFITHGGLMSTQESLYHAVPLIGIPLFGDQHLNLKHYEGKGMAVILNFNNINEQTMSAALDKVLNDPSYRNAAEKQSARFRDRPMSAMETATFWVEYIIRNGPDAVKSPAADLTWWQIELLDVYGFLIASAIILIYIGIFMFKLIFNIISGMLSTNNHQNNLTNGKKRD
ncbi:UDP-glycosyltransferase UGT5-like [Venturia canescens]|uniref:UDP-glycosyltransferase UGT5-like n=1 Tax=Venturia canescens TaxID=32260 RepID=UPI001C9D0074|nr:UDP-glycosyltransferase UGT5-like [Venturia canescens]